VILEKAHVIEIDNIGLHVLHRDIDGLANVRQKVRVAGTTTPPEALVNQVGVFDRLAVRIDLHPAARLRHFLEKCFGKQAAPLRVDPAFDAMFVQIFEEPFRAAHLFPFDLQA